MQVQCSFLLQCLSIQALHPWCPRAFIPVSLTLMSSSQLKLILSLANMTVNTKMSLGNLDFECRWEILKIEGTTLLKLASLVHSLFFPVSLSAIVLIPHL